MVQDLDYSTGAFQGCASELFPALAAVHNFILKWDPVEIADILPPSDNNINIVEDFGWLETEYLR